MKRRIIVIAAVIVAVLFVGAYLTGFFTKGVFSNHIYFPQNVYEEIWNMLVEETWGRTTMLSTIPDGAHRYCSRFYSYGVTYEEFAYISIREPEVMIRWTSEEDMRILLSVDKKDVNFVYAFDEQILYGEAEEAALLENFLTDYFHWHEVSSYASSRFSTDDLGAYTYQQVDSVWDVYE